MNRSPLKLSILLAATISATAIDSINARADIATCRSNCYNSSLNQGHCLAQCEIDTPSNSNFGAVAVSQSTGAYANSYKWPNRTIAEREARARCESQSGGKGDCVVGVWFKNACAALAMSPARSWGAAWGESARMAKSAALAKCSSVGGKDCAVVQVYCPG